MNEFVLKFTLDEMRIIDEALGALPYKKVAPLIMNINKQIAENRSNETKVNTEE